MQFKAIHPGIFARLCAAVTASLLAGFATPPAMAQYYPSQSFQGNYSGNANQYGSNQFSQYNQFGANQYNRYGSTQYNRYGSTQYNQYGSNRYGSNMYNQFGSSAYNRSGSSQYNRYGSNQYGNQYGSNRYGSSYGGNQRYRDPRTGQFDRSNRSNRSSRNRRGGGDDRNTPTPPGGAPAVSPTPGARPGQTGNPVATVRGKARPANKGGGSTDAGVTAEFTFKPTPDVAVLYMTPMQHNLAVGEEFETRVSLSNPAEKQYVSIEVVLRFNPLALEPLRLDDDRIRPLLDGNAEAVVYTDAGLMAYRGRLSEPLSAQAVDIFTVRWRTLSPASHAEIAFSGGRGYETALRNSNDDNILGGTGNEGSLGMSLRIFSPQEEADGPPIGEQLYSGYNDGTRDGVQLRLVTNKTEIPANEDFYVGVWFDNPRMVECSKIRFKIRFDEHVLEVVDDDTDNWITTGVNVHDGSYHDRFPFDIHVANSASNLTGLIEYAMACTQRGVLPENGYLARIRFRPKTLAQSTPIEFEFGANDDPLRTQVTYLGADVLGTSANPDDGVENLAVSILEPQLPRMLRIER